MLVDFDISEPNLHLAAELPEGEFVGDVATMTVTPPQSPHGFGAISPMHIRNGFSTTALENVMLCVAGIEVLIVDLPGGWTDAHRSFMDWFPHMVVTVCAATVTASSDHANLVKHVAAHQALTLEELERNDKRVKWDKRIPEAPQILVIETMSTFTGNILDTEGKPH